MKRFIFEHRNELKFAWAVSFWLVAMCVAGTMDCNMGLC